MQVPVVMQKKLFDITVLWIALQFNITVLCLNAVCSCRYIGRETAFSNCEMFFLLLSEHTNMKTTSNKYWPESYFINKQTETWAVITHICFLCAPNPGQNPVLVKAVQHKDSWKNCSWNTSLLPEAIWHFDIRRMRISKSLDLISSDLFITFHFVNYFVW